MAEYLTTRICRLLKERGEMNCADVAQWFQETVRKTGQTLNNLRTAGHVESRKDERGVFWYTCITSPLPPYRQKRIDGTPEQESRRKPSRSAGSGVIAPPRQPPDLSRTLQRNPFEAWELCVRDPVTTSQAAVHRCIR